MILRVAWAWPALTLLAMLPWTSAAPQNAVQADAMRVAKASLDACVRRIDDASTGLAEIEKRCPDLPAALQAAEVRPLIISTSRERMVRQSLMQLQGLLHPSLGPAPPLSKLVPFLHGVQAGSAARQTWWRRLWSWLLDHLTPKQHNSSGSWLDEMAQVLAGAQWFWTGLIWTLMVALAICVVVVLMPEMRAMGGRSIDDRLTGREIVAAGPIHSRLKLLRQSPVGQRPAQLFAMLISQLVMAGRLPPDRSLTHREVVRRAVLDGADQRRFMEILARLAERQLYSGLATTPEGVEELLARGEDLYTTGWSRPAEG